MTLTMTNKEIEEEDIFRSFNRLEKMLYDLGIGDYMISYKEYKAFRERMSVSEDRSRLSS